MSTKKQPRKTKAPNVSIQGMPPKPQSQGEDIHVGIIGGGIAGLFTAYTLAQNNIKFTLLEAGSQCGGRLHTHKFQFPDDIDPKIRESVDTSYLDMGAMRFPCNTSMGPVFKLFHNIGLDLKPYYLSDVQGNGQLFYNNRQLQEIGNQVIDLSPENSGFIIDFVADRSKFKLKLLEDGDPVWNPPSPDTLSNVQGKKLTIDEINQLINEWIEQWMPSKKTFGELMDARPQFEPLSQRQFLQDAFGVSDQMIDVLETFGSASGLYAASAFEHMCDSFAFESEEWTCIVGGARQLVVKMLESIAKATKNADQGKIITRAAVDKIEHLKAKKEIHVTYKEFNSTKTIHFTHVISTTTLPAFAQVNTTNLGLTYLQRNAIRTCKHDHSAKLGLFFKTRWWENPQIMGDTGPIFGGKSLTDLPVRVVVYPSYGFDEGDAKPLSFEENGQVKYTADVLAHSKKDRFATTLDGELITDSKGKKLYSHQVPGALIASYTWAQDAEFFGSQFENNSNFHKDGPLASLLLENLSKIHNVPIEFLEEQLIDGFYVDWHQNKYTTGPFSMFSPNQFDTLERLMKGDIADGRFYLAGEGVSVHHGWVLGSLKSSMQSLLLLFKKIGHTDAINKLIADWHIDIPDFSKYQPGLFLPMKDDEYSAMFQASGWAKADYNWRFQFNPTLSSVLPPATFTTKFGNMKKNKNSSFENDAKANNRIPITMTSSTPSVYLSVLTSAINSARGISSSQNDAITNDCKDEDFITPIAQPEGITQASPLPSLGANFGIQPLRLTKKQVFSFNKL